MDYSQLENYSYVELKQIAQSMSLPIHRTKAGIIEQVTEAFKEYEKYKRSKIDKYKRGKQLGEKHEQSNQLFVMEEAATARNPKLRCIIMHLMDLVLKKLYLAVFPSNRLHTSRLFHAKYALCVRCPVVR